ncbi:hypothetical protein V865_004214 [Kwoniella europaea PYCC6329]|uniref:Xylose isomerase-like TIM barrel domain-containing protein n=1 Tax=Kwoniella europaea PYCC6329 TaxID=1423913 RepID=A0AAX4KJ99_9TREE
MHTDGKSDSSTYNDNNSATEEDFDSIHSPVHNEVRYSSLSNQSLLSTPTFTPSSLDRSPDIPIISPPPSQCSLFNQGSVPELEFSQASQVSTQLQTPPSASSGKAHRYAQLEDPDNRLSPSTPSARKSKSVNHAIKQLSLTPPASNTTITLQSPIVAHRDDSPSSRIQQLTPRRRHRDGQETEKDILDTSAVKVELESPLRNLGLGTPRGHHRVESFHYLAEPGTPPSHSHSPLPSSTPGLDSPFRRLGLGTPRGRGRTPPLSPQPRPQSICDSDEFSPSPSPSTSPLKNRTKAQLHIPSPGWIPDTPTPYRFYTPGSISHKPTYDLTPPCQPIFTPSPSRDIKPTIPPTPSQIELENNSGDGEVSLNFISHVSMDGGILAALRKYKDHYQRQVVNMRECGGLNMFINPPKRGVKRREDDAEVRESAKIFRSFDEEFRRNSMAHAVHATNLLSHDRHLRDHSKESIITEMELAGTLGIPTLVIHLGSEGHDVDIQGDIIDRDRLDMLMGDLQDILDSTEGVVLAIENTVHPSPTSLTSLQSLALLLALFPHPRLRVCLDLAHVHIAELDLNDPERQEDLIELLKKIGKGRIAGVHVGGGGSEHGGQGKRHVGGSIELSSLRSILLHPIFHSIPILLETPRYHRYHRRPRSHSETGTKIKRIPASRVEELEEERSKLESSFLQYIVNLPDTDWEVNQYKLLKRYQRDKKKIENRIYKTLCKRKDRASAMWKRFGEGRKRELKCLRRVQGAKRRRMRDEG